MGVDDDSTGTTERHVRISTTPLPQPTAHAMIRRRAAAAGIKTLAGNHTFRATGITAYLKNGGVCQEPSWIENIGFRAE
jgi:hypothetical protein